MILIIYVDECYSIYFRDEIVYYSTYLISILIRYLSYYCLYLTIILIVLCTPMSYRLYQICILYIAFISMLYNKDSIIASFLFISQFVN